MQFGGDVQRVAIFAPRAIRPTRRAGRGCLRAGPASPRAPAHSGGGAPRGPHKHVRRPRDVPRALPGSAAARASLAAHGSWRPKVAGASSSAARNPVSSETRPRISRGGVLRLEKGPGELLGIEGPEIIDLLSDADPADRDADLRPDREGDA